MTQFYADQPFRVEKAEEVFSLLKNRKQVTLMCLPRTFRTYFGMSLLDRNNIKPFFSEEELSRYIFIYSDMQTDSADYKELLNEALSIYSNEPNILRKIAEISSVGKRIILYINNTNFDNADLLKYILQLKAYSKEQMTYVFGFIRSAFRTDAIQSSFAMIFENIIIAPYLSEKETFDWLDIISSSSINYSTKEHIYQFSGGIPGLIRATVDLLRKGKSFEEMRHQLEIKSIVQQLWNRFTENEQRVLLGEDIPEVSAYLKELRAIDASGKVIGTWIDLVEMKTMHQLHVLNNRIFFGLKNITDEFTKNEYTVLKQLILQEFLTKENIAELMWDEHVENKHSNWAIDQLILRIRKKLEILGVGNDSIKTQRGKGIELKQ